MQMTFRTYKLEGLFGGDYEKVRGFLISINRDSLFYPHFVWGRWEWMITHSMLDRAALNKLGIWESDGEVKGMALFDCELGKAYICTCAEAFYLKGDMLDYASENLSKDGKCKILIDNGDREFQRLARCKGYCPTQTKEEVAVIDIDQSLSYKLPKGYTFVSMADGWDYHQYNRVMWRGFNHKGEPAQTQKDINDRKTMLSSPMLNPELTLAVAAPDGSYVSHCGTWYAQGDKYAYVEPVATDPDYRKMGLGKAAVLEAVKRCGKRGAIKAIVGSAQQFYYRIGFNPVFTGVFWEKKEQ